ncbi:MAG: AMP-binding protein [Deltaproteobacteria bacterium]|nr:AMP-binding protein [Deltaproteobacteria bacterium]
MWCDYEEVKKKLYPGVASVESVKEAVELTSVLGQKTYLIDAVTGEEFSYDDSNKQVNRVAHGLLQMGLTKGDRIGFLMGNSPRCIFTILGIFKAGMTAVPINYNFQEKEIAHLVNTAGISTIVVDPHQQYLDILANVSSENDVLKTILIYGPGEVAARPKARLLQMEDLLADAGDGNPDIHVYGDDPCVIFFTSGTTGMPKGAPITNKIFLLAAQSVLAIPWTDHKTRNYTALPLFHANAQLYSMMAMRLLGTSLVLTDRFSPKKFFAEINQYQATYFNSIGGMMQILDAAFESTPVPEHTAQYVFVGGTPVELWQRFEEKFHVSIFEGYSQSESPVLFLNAHPDPGRRKAGSFGVPVFPDLGRHTKIVGEDGQDAPEGQDVTGELLQIGFNMKGYWGEEAKTKDAFTDGWLHSGDVVRRDKDGFHYFVDRLKFMIRKGGENISAFEIEDVINSYPGISESSVVPVPDPLREEEIKAFIVPVAGRAVDLTELIRHCITKLAYFKVPRFIEIVDSFPKTATERIQKMVLKEREKKKSDHGWDRDKEMPEWRQG